MISFDKNGPTAFFFFKLPRLKPISSGFYSVVFTVFTKIGK